MSDPLIRELDNYVVLEPNKEERFLKAQETLEWIENWINQIEQLPQDLLEKSSTKAAAQHLLDTACDLEIYPGFTIQWYAIRLDPPTH